MSLRGVFQPPGDKSISHRTALFSLLAQGRARVENFSPCADVRSSLDAALALGAQADLDGEDLVISGCRGRLKPAAHINCGNSGTTLRLLMGILAGGAGDYLLDGDASLRKRPMERVAAPLRQMGAEVQCAYGTCPVHIRGGRLHGIDFELPVASAQLKSAVLLAGIQADGQTLVRERVTSRDHTERMLRLMGGTISKTGDAWLVQRSSLTLPDLFRVPGDASSAAFFLCAGAIIPDSDVTAEGVLLNPTRSGFLEVLARMGARVEIERQGDEPEPWGRVRVRYSPNLIGCRIKAEEIPSLVDEVPILALVATQAHGTTIFEQVGELRVKESDRLAAIASQLTAMGANIVAEKETLSVEGPTRLNAPSHLDAFGDHRIAMTLRVAGLLEDAWPIIDSEDSIAISYPGFHDTLAELRR
ncbi:MAG: 3-phosphoshikimate 1-carboxyvinyltransferase [Thermodesulfobacteriota bacterium]